MPARKPSGRAGLTPTLRRRQFLRFGVRSIYGAWTKSRPERWPTSSRKIWARQITAPAYHCLGNHDVAGLTSDGFLDNDPDYGLNLLRRALGMPGLFYRFDHGGWRFIVLNNIRIAEGRFVAEYDEEQMAFVRAELATAPEQPTMIIGHYHTVTAVEFFAGDAESQDSAWSLGFSRATRNPMALVEAIGDANVRAVLSGHIHRLDRIKVKSQTFICLGSVSGAQWRGPDVDTPPGITIVDCRADGGFDLTYQSHEADPAPFQRRHPCRHR